MKKILSPVCFLLYFLSVITFFFAGATFAAISDAAKDQGLAGGGIVFIYGLIGSITELAVALFIAYQAERKTIVKVNRILTVLLLVLVVITFYRFQQRQAAHASADTPNNDAREFRAAVSSDDEAAVGLQKKHISLVR